MESLLAKINMVLTAKQIQMRSVNKTIFQTTLFIIFLSAPNASSVLFNRK